ncbi:hypothetical protein [Corallococcus exiguus]|uniref:hypothetical protein n=1 Tax=Corallococcus exiguus TaxID=83462 RepID=UPI001C12EC0A|nr:hypothetical protein [Corallococcus exiguus]
MLPRLGVAVLAVSDVAVEHDGLARISAHAKRAARHHVGEEEIGFSPQLHPTDAILVPGQQVGPFALAPFVALQVEGLRGDEAVGRVGVDRHGSARRPTEGPGDHGVATQRLELGLLLFPFQIRLVLIRVLGFLEPVLHEDPVTAFRRPETEQLSFVADEVPLPGEQVVRLDAAPHQDDLLMDELLWIGDEHDRPSPGIARASWRRWSAPRSRKQR